MIIFMIPNIVGNGNKHLCLNAHSEPTTHIHVIYISIDSSLRWLNIQCFLLKWNHGLDLTRFLLDSVRNFISPQPKETHTHTHKQWALFFLLLLCLFFPELIRSNAQLFRNTVKKSRFFMCGCCMAQNVINRIGKLH